MPDPKFLILDADSRRLVACDEFGDEGNNLAATEFTPVPQNCFCDEPTQVCIGIMENCQEFCLVPAPITTTGQFIVGVACNFTSTFTLDYPLSNDAFRDVIFARQFHGRWCGGAPFPFCGPPFGGVIGHWTLETTGECVNNPFLNFTDKPLYSNHTDASNAGCSVVAGECALVHAQLDCNNGIPGLFNSFWLLYIELHIGEFNDVYICPLWRWETNQDISICPTNSSIFNMPGGKAFGCGHGGLLIAHDPHTLTGLNFFT